MENGIWGKMTEIKPIEEQETLEKRVERKAQTSDELGDEDYPLPLAVGREGRGQENLTHTHGAWAFSHDGEVPIGLELGDGADSDVGGHPLPPLAGGLGRWSSSSLPLASNLLR